jgi:uncharacterized protein YjlB
VTGAVDLAAISKNSGAELFHFDRDGGVPNSRLPLVFWRGRLPREARDGAAAGVLFRRNGWQGTWVSNVLPFWHFHTRGHEVLACVSGKARIGFGGDHGIKVDVETGDACVIPAGVGHIRLDASGDFRIGRRLPPATAGQHCQARRSRRRDDRPRDCCIGVAGNRSDQRAHGRGCRDLARDQGIVHLGTVYFLAHEIDCLWKTRERGKK